VLGESLLAGLLGFVFANTAHDILGGAVAVDSDLALNLLGTGMAHIADTNGLSSFEFVFGPGIGILLIGVAHAITAELDEATLMDPSIVPSLKPTHVPTTRPLTPVPINPVPTNVIPTRSQSSAPSLVPSKAPSRVPSGAPSRVPSKVPSEAPSRVPSRAPSKLPSLVLSRAPSRVPSKVPSEARHRVLSQVPSWVNTHEVPGPLLMMPKDPLNKVEFQSLP